MLTLSWERSILPKLYARMTSERREQERLCSQSQLLRCTLIGSRLSRILCTGHEWGLRRWHVGVATPGGQGLCRCLYSTAVTLKHGAKEGYTAHTGEFVPGYVANGSDEVGRGLRCSQGGQNLVHVGGNGVVAVGCS